MKAYHKRIIENIFSLGLINGINLIIPLVTLPYLIRTIGIDNYGSYSIVYAMLQYGILFSNYGFGFSSTQAIAQNRENSERVSIIVISTLMARLMIMVGVSVIMGIICVFFYSKEYLIMYFCGLGMILGDVMNPVWLYQGMEKMKFLAIINLVSKSIFTLLIFIFIKDVSDYPLVTLLNSIGYLVAGIFSLLWGYKMFSLHWMKPKVMHIKEQYKSGWYIFLSTISMNLYRNSNVFVLGFFLSPGLVGIYSGAEKVIKAFQAIVSPIANALFPYVARSFRTQDRQGQWRSIKKFTAYISIFLLFLSLCAFFSATFTNKILLDRLDNKAVLLIKLMSPVIIFGGLNYILGIVGLVNANEKKAFFHFVMISGLISIGFLLSTVTNLGVFSGGISMTLCEIILFIMCIGYWIKIKTKS